MYDYVFVTHLPSFYKVNLYQEIQKSKKIFVIFIASGSEQRTQDFVCSQFTFDHVFLNQGAFEQRNKIWSSLRFLRVLLSLQYRRLVVGGWNLPEFWVGVLFSPLSKNALALESSSIESVVTGPKAKLKVFFLTRISLVFATGGLHQNLLEKLGYTGQRLITRGVGIIHKPARSVRRKTYEKKFVYVGRLSPEKNLTFLIQIFSALPDFQLKIVGDGPLDTVLKANSPANVTFQNHVKNKDMGSVLSQHDFLILPSISETWGLVVEEAFYFGRPVIVSRNCGVSELIDSNNGTLFKPEDSNELISILKSITDEKFQRFLSHLETIDSSEKDRLQVEAYTQAGVME
jgi:glycosyltransferase involved in cell wall biosynthesis